MARRGCKAVGLLWLSPLTPTPEGRALANEAREVFLAAGGQRLAPVPPLVHSSTIPAIFAQVLRHLPRISS